MAVKPGDNPPLTDEDRKRVDALEPLIDNVLLNHRPSPSDDRIFFNFTGPEWFLKGESLNKAQFLEIQRRYSHWIVTEFKDTKEPYSIYFQPRSS